MELDTRPLENAQLIAAVFEHAPHGIAIADLAGRYVKANPAFLRLLGYTEQELLQKTIHDVTHPEDTRENRRVFEDTAAGLGDQIEFEKRYLRKDGRAIWVRNTMAKVPGPEGEPRYILALVEDISVRRHADQKLRESEQLVRAIFESSPLGVSIADTRLNFLKANASYQRFLGYTEDELLARSVRDITHPEDYEENARRCEALLSGLRGEFTMDKRFVRKDGSIAWGRLTVTLIRGYDGAPHHFTSLVLDISEQRRAEDRELNEEKALLEATFKLQALTRRLVQAEEMERHRVAGELHDRVGQNLSALNINLDIALGLLPKESMEVRMRIADSLGLVDGTLQTIENLMAELRPPLLDEYGLSAALGLYVQGFAQRNGLSVAVDDPSELSGGLRREVAIALFRIAQEALANVAKHARAKKVRVLLEKHDNEIVLDISDDGTGFDQRERLAHSTRWGMATVQERAAAVGGRVEVHSTLGGGTTVRVSIPNVSEKGGTP